MELDLDQPLRFLFFEFRSRCCCWHGRGDSVVAFASDTNESVVPAVAIAPGVSVEPVTSRGRLVHRPRVWFGWCEFGVLLVLVSAVAVSSP